jgi:hypothetical protein
MLIDLLAWALGFLALAMMSVNAIFMLISPRLWFQLPSWIRANGRFTKERNSSGPGALAVRILGGLFSLVLLVFMAAIIEHIAERLGGKPGT